MIYLSLVLFLFIATVFAHLTFCRRTSKSGLQAKAFVLMAMMAFGVYAGGVLILQHTAALDKHSLWGVPFGFTGAIIFILLIPVYLSIYVLTQLSSPSKKILMTISLVGEASYNDMVSAIQKEDFITSRLNDLLASQCLTSRNGRYVLTTDGQKIAAILNLMQFILGRKAGG